jgi:hypothetical protein
MIFLSSPKEAAGYTNRLAAAIYNLGGGGHPPQNGLVRGQYYVGQILEGGRFQVLKPDRLCSVSEFVSFQVVSLRWDDLSDLQHLLLMMAYNQKKLELGGPSVQPLPNWQAALAALERAGYLRWAGEQVMELTPVGEAEVEHRLFNRAAGDDLLDQPGGIRVRHHSPRNTKLTWGAVPRWL